MDFIITWGMYIFVLSTIVGLAIAFATNARRHKNISGINVYNLSPHNHYNGVVYCLS